MIGLGLTGFGAAIEVSQALRIVHRYPSWIDVFVDAIAVALGLAAGAALLDLVRHRSSRQEPL